MYTMRYAKHMIKCTDLHLDYPAADGSMVNALNGLSVEIGASQFVTVMGPNGSGKSTLAMCLAGLQDLTGGEIIIDGIDIGSRISDGSIRDKIGIVFQNPDDQLLTYFIDRELALILENRGVPGDEMTRRVDLAIERFGMTGYTGVSPAQLSGGQKQKLALASILIGEPRYLILDETTSYLDPGERKTILSILNEEFERRKESGFSIILITQFAREAVQSDRVIILNNGAVSADGKPDKVFTGQGVFLSEIGVDIPPEFRLTNALPGISVESRLFS